MSDSTNNKKIAVNTIYLYIRLLVSLTLNLYMSRILLEALGVEDFGTYNIVGGIVFLMLFVNSTLQNSSLRFINISIGEGVIDAVKETVNTSIQLHTILFIIFLLIGETGGLWYVCNQLNVPENSYNTVLVVYQMSLITAAITILQVPFTSLIISYEKMDIYAKIEIVNVGLKCICILMLPLFTNKLLAYAGLILALATLIGALYIFFFKRLIRTFRLDIKIHKKRLHEMISFSLFNLIGDGTFAVRQQGTNLLINNYFGVALNAASGVATQAASLVSTFVSNTQSAFKPQIFKEYAAMNYNRMKELVLREIEVMFVLLAFILNVTYINLDFLMKLWLKKAPENAVEFCGVILLCNALLVCTQIMSTAIHATGKIRLFNIINGTLNLFCLVLVFAFYSIGCTPVSAYYAYMIIIMLKIIAEAFVLSRNIPDFTYKFLCDSIKKPILLLSISFVATYSISSIISGSLYKFLISVFINTIIVTILSLLMYPYMRRMAQDLSYKLKKHILNGK